MSINFSGFIASIIAKTQPLFDAAHSAMVDYFTLSALEEPNTKGNMPWDAEFHYHQNNVLNGLWVAIYGNTTDTTPQDKAPEAMPRDIAWKPVHTLCRAQQALDTYKRRRTYCDDTLEQFDPEAAANDQQFLRLAARAEREQAKFDMFMSKFLAEKEFFEALFETQWVYKPYKVTKEGETTGGTMNAAQSAFAAKLKAMKNRNTGEAPETEAA